MKKITLLFLVSTLWGQQVNAAKPVPFTEAKIFQVVNQVEVLDGDSLASNPAVIESLFQAPDLLKTGRRSRAQLMAEDGTITRVGSNTLFSFEPDTRTINLKNGSLLFHSPKGKGGGTVVTSSATASVVGTTIIVAATNNGGFKMLCLEGKARVDFPSGRSLNIGAGQMTFVLPPKVGSRDNASRDNRNSNQQSGASETKGPKPTSSRPGPVLNFDLEKQRGSSSLLNGFSQELPSLPKIESAMKRQNKLKEKQQLAETGKLVVGATDEDQIQVVDDSFLERANSNGNINSDNVRLSFAIESNVTVDDLADIPSKNQFRDYVSFTEEQSEFLATSPFDNLYSGLIAKNILFKGDEIDLSHLDSVDRPRIGIVAARQIVFNEPVTDITGLKDSDALHLVASTITGPFGDTTERSVFTLKPSSTDKNHRFIVESETAIRLENASIINEAGSLELVSTKGNFKLLDGSLLMTMNGTSDSGGSGISFSAYKDIDISDSTIDAGVEKVMIGYIDPFPVPTPVDVTIRNGTVINASALDVRASDTINIANIDISSVHEIELSADTVRLVNIDFPVSSTVNINANSLAIQSVNTLELTNTGISSVREISLAAQTLNLENIHFSGGSIVNLASKDGRLNVGRTAVNGFVNFIENVTYDGVAAEYVVSVDVGGMAATSDEVKINISKTN